MPSSSASVIPKRQIMPQKYVITDAFTFPFTLKLGLSQYACLHDLLCALATLPTSRKVAG